ncbi:helix-turn-helix transcriptional regulator [[Mycobacterium] wendilense]|uniref:LuxR C-terminal-related transcriptional regulator n=1 Tax=[Mycobacterium] wendilense TaxID=3064284 RepID=A0ABM9MIG8_9MYCO|nr:LuxR C-terminal-related transcriptional regulator [Mycolicibacterium sp. MU0050]CAJ1585851.1 LuxR C-terminal-related transcriptional regulator [Mycolicibacterium sp. MU0050]
MISGDTLTGRDRELTTLRRALSGVGNFAGVLVAGPAGVGKTRLARELLSQAAAAGTQTDWIVGTASARPIPLGAFTATIGEHVNDPNPSVRRVITALLARQRQGRVVIGVDDAHLLDGFSAHVVHQIAQSRQARLVVTVRTGAGEPDAVRALWKDGLLARLDLEPLCPQGARAMVEAALEGPMDARSAQRFWRLTGGNALFLRQLLKDQVAAGRVRKVKGVWIWDGDVAVSQNMSDLVGNQLDRLAPEQAAVLDTLSQCEPLDVGVLADLVGRAAVETAEQMHLITVERCADELTARLAHPLFGELRRVAAGELYLSKIRGALAQRLAGRDGGDAQSLVRRALLRLESDLPPDPALYVEAARATMTLLDLDLAQRFAAAAAAAGSAEATEIMAVNRFLAGDGPAAEQTLSALAARGGDRHRWTTLRAANLIWMLGRPAAAEELLAELAGRTETDAQRAARYSVEACVDAVFARCAEAERKARYALDCPELSDLNAMLAAVSLIMAAGALGHADDIGPVARAALDRATGSYETSHMRFWFAGVYARACRLTGRLEECRRAAELLSELAQDMPSLAYANLVFMVGAVELMRGDVGSATKKLHEALAGVETHGVTTGLRAACVFGLAEAHAKLGEAQAATEMLGEARQSARPEFLFMHTALALATGWVLAAGGSLAEAVDTVLAEARVARRRGQPTHELACLQAAAQWGAGQDIGEICERTAELAETLRLPLADAVAAHAAGLRAGDGEALLAVSTAYQHIGDRAAAADAAAQAAVAFTGAQLRSRGLFAAALAAQLAQECGGLCTPATRSPVSPTPLTGRQREVAELVAAGMSNKEIADRLVTSVRTVEGHLYRACQRVGASSRSDLAAIMRAGPGS